MDKVMTFIIEVVIAIVIMFASVTIYFGLRMETLIKTTAVNVTDDFISDVKKKGFFTVEDYENYLEQLSLSHTLYDISFEHTYPIWEPEYRMKTLQEILDDQNATYTRKNIYTYRDVITALPSVPDPVNTGNLNSETNESVLAKAVNTPALTSHVHTDDCYDGHRHTDGQSVTSSNYSHGCYTDLDTTYDFCTGTLSLKNAESVTNTSKCNYCGDSFSETYSIYTYSCNNCGNISILKSPHTISWTCKCGKSKWSLLEDGGNSSAGSKAGTTCNQAKTNTIYKCKQEEDTTSECNKVVVSISPTHPLQIVAKGDSIISTVVATYLDGSTQTIVATVSGYDRNQLGTQVVTLTYSGLINNAKTTGTKTCTIKVTVVPLSKTCKNVHTYNLNSDGSDPGCPYCKAYVSTLQIVNPTSPNMTITIGTSLKDNGVKLLVTYMDGRTEIITSEYADNLDTTYLGTMLVTIGYKGVKTQLRVNTICAQMKCDICGNFYNLYPDGTDPGCPYCIAKIPVFTGNVLEFAESEFNENILENLYKEGIYKFSKKDEFIIKLNNKSSNLARGILRKFLPSISDSWLYLRIGDRISTNRKD